LELTEHAMRLRTQHLLIALALAWGAGCGADEPSQEPASTSTSSSSSSGSGGEQPDASAGGAGTGGSLPDGGSGGSGAGPVGQGCITGSFTAYRGNFHAHTSYSDGDDEPQDAFAYARDVAGLDIMMVTDHLEQLYLVPPLNRWGACETQANAANAPGAFLADCGYEYGSGMALPLCVSTGHNNVLFPTGLFPAVQQDFHDFYATFVACAECIGQFNHPGSESCQHWNFFEYDPAVDERMNLFEFNGSGPVWDMFFQALDAGWHVSPMVNQDNHSANWGTASDDRSGVYLSALSRDALRQALLERRTFMSEDANAAIQLMAEDTCWMGSMLSGYPAVELDAHAEDPDGADGFVSLELFGPGQALLASTDCAGAGTCDLTHGITVSAPTYAVARATQSDGQLLVAAPIWLAP
jgi:hypothetical protein